MSLGGFCTIGYQTCQFQRVLLCILLYRSIDSVLSLVPVPQNKATNDTIEVLIHHDKECRTGYYRVQSNYAISSTALYEKTIPPCRLCTSCRKGEDEIQQCTPVRNRVCQCPGGYGYYTKLDECVPLQGIQQNWTIIDYHRWLEDQNPSPTSQPEGIFSTTKMQKEVKVMLSNSLSQDAKDQVEHAVKPDWTDFYILTVSSTAVLFFTLSLVLLFLMAVMKARSWYLYRRLPGTGITLCFRGWLTRAITRHRDRSTSPIQETGQHSDQGTTTRDTENKEDDEERTREEPILVASSPTEEFSPPITHRLTNEEVVDYLCEIDAIVCCADLKFTFPQKKTYVSSCITSEADVVDTRSQGSPNFILQACHNTVNVVLGQKDHKCCRHRNMLTLNSNDTCSLGQFEAVTMEVQDGWEGKFHEKPSSSLATDETETSMLIEENSNSCQHEQTAFINPNDILKLYMEIAKPFKDSQDLKFCGSLQLYLKKGFSHCNSLQEKVKLKYKSRKERANYEENKEINTLLQQRNGDAVANCRTSVLCPLYSHSEECLIHGNLRFQGDRLAGSSPCLEDNSLYDTKEKEERRLSLACGEAMVECIPDATVNDYCSSEVVSEGSIEVTVDVHNQEHCTLHNLEATLGEVSPDELQPLTTKFPSQKERKLLVVTSV